MFFEAKIKKKLFNFMLDLFIQINKGEYTIMLGPSGAGKSMTLKIIAGIESSLYQRIIMDGVDISRLPPEKRNIVYLPQKNSLFPHINVFENIVFPFFANGKSINKDLLNKVINTFRIEPLLKRMPKNLSGGEARRVALARAICAKPKLLLLDEPLSSLDFYMRQELIEFLKKITEEYHITILHVTHDPIEAFLLAQKIYILQNGKVRSYLNFQIYKKVINKLVKKLTELTSFSLRNSDF